MRGAVKVNSCLCKQVAASTFHLGVACFLAFVGVAERVRASSSASGMPLSLIAVVPGFVLLLIPSAYAIVSPPMALQPLTRSPHAPHGRVQKDDNLDQNFFSFDTLPSDESRVTHFGSAFLLAPMIESPEISRNLARVAPPSHTGKHGMLTLAVAHGGWKSDAHERYERFSASQVLALPAAMLAAGAADAEGASALPVAPVVPAAPVAQSPAVPISVPVRPMQPSPTPARGRARGVSAQRQQAAAAVEAPSSSSGRPPRPLSYEHAAGRRVLVPSSLWPRYACTEHGGEGWEGLISKVRTTRVDQAQQALVDFVDRRRSGAGWQPVWLPLDSLRPLV